MVIGSKYPRRAAQFVAMLAVVGATTLALWGEPGATGGDAASAKKPAAAPASDPKPTADSLSDAQVVAAIDRGMQFLIEDFDRKLKIIDALPASQRGDPKAVPDAGEFMLESYALLHVGADVRDSRVYVQSDRMKAAASVILNMDDEKTYTTSLQALALAEMPHTQAVTQAITRAAKKLMDGRGKVGGYTYDLGKNGEFHDQSNSQYALLGVWAAADWGVAIPGSYWKETDAFWRAIQLPDGGWGYSGFITPQTIDHSTPSMIAAGIASLYVCDEFLNRKPRLTPREDPALDKGMTALLEKFDPESNDFYYLYGLERVGLATGKKFIGKVDWYRHVAVNILQCQQTDGHFDGKFMGSNPVRSTCYAIIVLARGRAPVLMNKLEYDGEWNLRPRDSANVHAYVARTLERHMNWQVVPMDSSPDEWLDAPILLITGAKDPHFTTDDVDKLREFVRAGGMVFSSADGNSPEFMAAMKKYALEAAGDTGSPAPDSAYRELPADHPLFTVSGKMSNPPKLLGVSNGLRELWIQGTVDYGAIWQSRDMSKKTAWELPVMLYSYVAGAEELRSKLQPLSLPTTDRESSRKVTMAQLSYKGNWNAEPGAWPRLAKLMALDGSADVTIKNVPTEALAALEPRPALAHLSGIGTLNLSDDEKKSLKAYVESGGTLFVEALAGDATFAKSADDLLTELFPGTVRKLVPMRYTFYKGDFSPGASFIPEVKYRRFWTLEHGRQTQPRLEFMTVNKRVGVFISGEDVTSGLLGSHTWGIGGYAPHSAVEIARNIVLYAERNGKAKVAPHR